MLFLATRVTVHTAGVPDPNTIYSTNFTSSFRTILVSLLLVNGFDLVSVIDNFRSLEIFGIFQLAKVRSVYRSCIRTLHPWYSILWHFVYRSSAEAYSLE